VRASVPRHRRPAFLSFVSGLALAVALVAGTARADDPGTLQREADRLRSQNAQLDREAARALLELFALESRLRKSERRVAQLKVRVQELERQEESARNQLEVARSSETAAQEALAERVRTLYIEGEPEPLEIILGATSLDELIDAIDSVNRLADHDERIIEQVQNARRSLRAALRELAVQQEELRQLTRAAETARATLARARDEKAAYLASLVRQRDLNTREIASLTARARAAEERAAVIAAATPQPSEAPAPSSSSQPGPSPSGVDVSPEPGRQVTVSATKYCLRGTTATGIPVQHGVIATDPAYIPLGTRLYVPGYGEGVAADTGGAVRGWTIDLWVESCVEASAYGRQTVTITIYD
jgi:3D (Asp-Asp-Asp) domain-containing protein/septal ring factor EnvC (AmiA/AmiB activator)